MFEPRDSKHILDWYEHPKYATPPQEGQGRYIMMNQLLEVFSCSSGNELRRIHELDPSRWLTGPIWVPLSKEDNDRIRAKEDHMMDNW